MHEDLLNRKFDLFKNLCLELRPKIKSELVDKISASSSWIIQISRRNEMRTGICQEYESTGYLTRHIKRKAAALFLKQYTAVQEAAIASEEAFPDSSMYGYVIWLPLFSVCIERAEQ